MLLNGFTWGEGEKESLFLFFKKIMQVSVSIPKNWIEEAGIQLPFPSKKNARILLDTLCGFM